MPPKWTFRVPGGRIEFHPTPAIGDHPARPLSAFALPLVGWLLFLIGWSVLGLLLCLVAYRLSRAQVLDTYSYMIGTFVGEIVWSVACVFAVTLYVAAGETGPAIIPLYVIVGCLPLARGALPQGDRFPCRRSTDRRSRHLVALSAEKALPRRCVIAPNAGFRLKGAATAVRYTPLKLKEFVVMAAFLFLPVAASAGTQRRVDFANIASLFAEIEEPIAAHSTNRLVARLLAFVLILLIAVGDMVLVAHPDAAAYAPPVSAQGRAVTSL